MVVWRDMCSGERSPKWLGLERPLDRSSPSAKSKVARNSQARILLLFIISSTVNMFTVALSVCI